MNRIRWTHIDGCHHSPDLPEAQIETRGAVLVLIDTQDGEEVARGVDLGRLKRHAEVVFGSFLA